MDQTLEHRIRQRAYEIWHADGQADGNADQHWLAAEREVLSSLNARAPAGATSAPAKTGKSARAGSRTAPQRPTKSSKTSARAPARA